MSEEIAATVLALLARVEKATRADRDLDRAIFEALGFEMRWVERDTENIFGEPRQTQTWYLVGYPSTGDAIRSHHITESLDAALALVERRLKGAVVEMEIAPGRCGVSLNCAGFHTATRADEQIALALLSALLRAEIARGETS